MELKVYSQKNCKYCENIKKVLDENKMVFETIEIDDNRDEWNELTRIIGMGMTPTIKFGDEIWVPSRDFRGPEELISRIKYFEEYPPKPVNEEEKVEMLLHGMRNIAMSLNNLGQQISNIHQKVNELSPPPKPTPVKQEVKKEITSN